MPKTRFLTEFGMGTSLRRQDYTEAAMRAVRDALWHNSINLAELLGRDKTDMLIDVDVGVQQPEAVEVARVAEVFPYGQVQVQARHGGLDIPRADGGKPTVIANVAISVSFELEGTE
ncbi:MAG: Lin0512 family protein [Rhodobacteraceae bacterium]|nr:Lin0512 family protein [Paracoccaceae bacterium]